MASVDSFQVSFQKRSTQGLDPHEHEQATVTVNVALDNNDEPSDTAGRASELARDHVLSLLGLPGGAGSSNLTRNASVKVDEAPARTQAPQQAPVKSETSATSPTLPTETNNVRGHNAEELRKRLIACAHAGIEIPQEQLNRLPKSQAGAVRGEINKIAQESQGSHDDPPVDGSGFVDDDPLGDMGDDPPVDGSGFVDDDPLGDMGDGPAPASSGSNDDDDPLGDMGDGPAPASSGSNDDDDFADILSDDTPEPEPEFEPVDRATLQERLRDLKSRFGGTAEIKAAIETYAGEGAKNPGQIAEADRGKFLRDLEKRAKEKGV